MYFYRKSTRVDRVIENPRLTGLRRYVPPPTKTKNAETQTPLVHTTSSPLNSRAEKLSAKKHQPYRFSIPVKRKPKDKHNKVIGYQRYASPELAKLTSENNRLKKALGNAVRSS
jgi:hypothetical protein